MGGKLPYVDKQVHRAVTCNVSVIILVTFLSYYLRSRDFSLAQMNPLLVNLNSSGN